MRCVWAHWPDIRNKISKKKRKFLLLDFDGTLVPIVKRPEDVRVLPKTRTVLSRLAKKTGFHLAILSGRSLKDLQSFIRLKAIYFGNHGLEFKGLRVKLPRRGQKARKSKSQIHALANILKRTLKDIPGVLVEDKGFTLSLHYRNVPRSQINHFHKRLLKLQRMNAHVKWRTGKMLWDIRPKVNWGKGDAARLLLKRYPGSLPIVMGDDDTDEDMFKVIRSKGIAIRVGKRTQSQAAYYLESPREALSFLERLSLL